MSFTLGHSIVFRVRVEIQIVHCCWIVSPGLLFLMMMSYIPVGSRLSFHRAHGMIPSRRVVCYASARSQSIR
jgi:hypothetical protein